jgi:hypothetical protein
MQNFYDIRQWSVKSCNGKLTGRVKEVLVEGVTPQLKSKFGLYEKIILRVVVLRVICWTVESESLQAFDGKDEDALSVVVVDSALKEIYNPPWRYQFTLRVPADI